MSDMAKLIYQNATRNIAASGQPFDATAVNKGLQTEADRDWETQL